MSVGVVITCHNEREWIADAVHSAIQQTTMPQRIVVVDDGSTDDPLREIRPWVNTAYGVELLTITQRGMAAARNAGIMALGDCDWIVHLDGDDYLEDNFIEECLLLWKRRAYDAVVTNVLSDDDTVYTPPFVDLASILERCELPSCAMYWREALVGVGGFRSDLGGDCDWGMWVELLARGARVGYASSRTGYHHRTHPGSLTTVETPADRERHHEIIRRLACQYPR